MFILISLFYKKFIIITGKGTELLIPSAYITGSVQPKILMTMYCHDCIFKDLAEVKLSDLSKLKESL